MKYYAAIAMAVAALAATAPVAMAEPNLVGQWHFDEGSGTAVADSSGNGNNGTILRGTTWVDGRLGGGLFFDGTGRVLVADNAALEPPTTVSVSAWIRNLGSPGDYRYIMAKSASGCITASYGLYSGPSGGLIFYVSRNRGTAYSRSPDAGTGVWDGNWHLVVGTFDGTFVRLYVDGHQIGNGTERPGPLEYLFPNSNDLFIGDYPGCQPHNFKGTIDELNIWRVALTPAQVTAAFDHPGVDPVPASEQPPTGGGTGGGGTSRGGTGGQNGTGGGRGNVPAIRNLIVTPSAFALDVGHARLIHSRRAGATISYTDTRAATSSFTVFSRHTGARVNGKCVAPSRRPHGKRCFFYTRVGSFTHTDVAGRNSFHFAGLRGHRLAAGSYRLDATPRASGLVGRTISVPFTIVR
jgi:Concanavalin A-like lectin/glucanases superfamily